MAVVEDAVREELKKVIDPELFVNIVDLGLIYVVDIRPSGEAEGAAASEPSASAGDPVPSSDAPPAADPVASAAAPTSESAGNESSEPEVGASDGGGDAAGAPPASSAGGCKVSIEMTMTSPMCPAGPQLVAQSKQVVQQMEGVDDVEVKVVMDPPWTPDRMTDEARDQLGIF